MIFLQHIRVLAEDRDRVHQQIAEIAGVQRRQPLLVGGVEFAALAVGEGAGVAFRDVGGAEALVLPGVDHAGELLGRPALVVEAFGLDQLLDQAHDVVGVEDGEVGAQADEFGVAAQQLDADRVEGAEPGHALDRTADEHGDALLHLAGGLVGEGDGEDLRGKARPVVRIWAMRVVSTRVLPVPAPASTRTGPSSVSTASVCSGLRPER